VVTLRSAKPPCAGSIPAHVSKKKLFSFFFEVGETELLYFARQNILDTLKYFCWTIFVKNQKSRAGPSTGVRLITMTDLEKR